jgi:hypothetical protein
LFISNNPHIFVPSAKATRAARPSGLNIIHMILDSIIRQLLIIEKGEAQGGPVETALAARAASLAAEMAAHIASAHPAWADTARSMAQQCVHAAAAIAVKNADPNW